MNMTWIITTAEGDSRNIKEMPQHGYRLLTSSIKMANFPEPQVCARAVSRRNNHVGA